jgi:glycosyltransferase involved in cell wall biosynthesis
LFYRRRCSRADAVVAVSEAARVSLERRGIRPDWIEVIHNGVDLEVFRPAEGHESQATGESTVHFACPSRILPGKGQHLALDALARLRRDYKTRAHLTIVGAVDDPIFRDQLSIQSYEQPARILGEVPDLASYYQQADVVVFPSLMEEGFGYTAVEAMACGKPVIWFDQPAVREACGGIGLPVEMGDVDGLRSAMMTLMDDPTLRARLGAEGRAFVEAHYGWDDVWSKYESLLVQVAQKTRVAAE